MPESLHFQCLACYRPGCDDQERENEGAVAGEWSGTARETAAAAHRDRGQTDTGLSGSRRAREPGPENRRGLTGRR